METPAARLFTSRTPRDLNHDPKPYVYRAPGYTARYAHGVARIDVTRRVVYEPRPEFDHKQHNEPNPILVKFRSIPEESRPAWFEGFMISASRVRFANWEDWQVDHARRVLTRLARLDEAS